MDFLSQFMPQDLSSWEIMFLVAMNFFASALTISVGLGGGVIMLAILANIVPIGAVVPVHGVVLMGNNVSRSFVLRKHITWSIAAWFIGGTILGVMFAAPLVITLPKAWLFVAIGLFILYTVWGQSGFLTRFSKQVYFIGGTVTGFLTLFIGATGPLVAALLPKKQLEPQQIVATHGFLMSFQHGIKLVAFGALGFAFAQWLGLIVLMIMAGYLGAFMGSKILQKIPKALFKKIFSIVLCLLALRLFYQAYQVGF